MCNTILLHAKWGLVYSNAFLILFTFKPSTCIRSRFVHVILMTAKQKVKANKWFEHDMYYGVNCYQPALISSWFLQGIYWASSLVKQPDSRWHWHWQTASLELRLRHHRTAKSPRKWSRRWLHSFDSKHEMRLQGSDDINLMLNRPKFFLGTKIKSINAPLPQDG